MKLLYLYVKNSRCFKDQELNFDSRMRFHFNHDNDICSLECKKDDSFPNHLFSTEKDKETICSISAIIGNNGSRNFYLTNLSKGAKSPCPICIVI